MRPSSLSSARVQTLSAPAGSSKSSPKASGESSRAWPITRAPLARRAARTAAPMPRLVPVTRMWGESAAMPVN